MSSANPLPSLAASSLSTPSSHAFETPVPSTSASVTPPHLLSEKYDLPRSLAHLRRLSPAAKNVALQFPDELLGDSVEVFRAIQAELDRIGQGGRAWVLGDTTYGSCCIDSLSALHIGADFLIHYGHACLTPCADPSLVGRIRYVFPRLPFDVPSCAGVIERLALAPPSGDDGEDEKKGVLVVHEVGYEHAAEALEADVRRRLKGKGREVIFSHIRLDGQDDDDEDEVERATVLPALERLEVVDGSDTPSCCRKSAAEEPSSGMLGQSSCCGGSSCSTLPAPQAISTCCQSSNPSDASLASNSCCSGLSSAADPASSCCSSRTPVATSSSQPGSAATSTSTTSTSLRSYALPAGTKLEDFVVFFIGREESLQLRNVLVTHSRNTVYSYSPSEDPDAPATDAPEPVLQSTRTNRLLMRRYATMQKARDADVFGLLVGNVNLAGSLPLLNHLRTLLKAKHKKTYTVAVGKLNPAKLANFAEVECFVLVACGENTLVDSKDFYRPIITPYELELALQDEPQWGATEYVLDFTKLLPEGSGPTDEQAPPSVDPDATAEQAGSASDDDDDQPIFSTITGTYRHPKRYGATTTTSSSTTHSTSLTLRSTDSDLIHTNLPNPSELWKGRTWVGLDPRVGLDKVGVLEEGRGGRAWNYEEEKERKE